MSVNKFFLRGNYFPKVGRKRTDDIIAAKPGFSVNWPPGFRSPDVHNEKLCFLIWGVSENAFVSLYETYDGLYFDAV